MRSAPDAADLQSIGHVIDDLAVRQQAEVLEDHGDLVPPQLAEPAGVRGQDVLAVEHDLPAVGSIRRSRTDERRLPRARQAHHHEHLARRDVEAHVARRPCSRCARAARAGSARSSSGDRARAGLGPNTFHRSRTEIADRGVAPCGCSGAAVTLRVADSDICSPALVRVGHLTPAPLHRMAGEARVKETTRSERAPLDHLTSRDSWRRSHRAEPVRGREMDRRLRRDRRRAQPVRRECGRDRGPGRSRRRRGGGRRRPRRVRRSPRLAGRPGRGAGRGPAPRRGPAPARQGAPRPRRDARHR